MTDREIGRAFRAVRIKKGLRQSDVAEAAGVSQQTVSKVEGGRFARLSVDVMRRVATAIDARVEIEFRWQGADLARLVGGRHSAMHEAVAGIFAGLPEWVAQPEVSFSIYGERGIIDIVAWHAPTQSLLVIELKTELVDLQETLGTFDRKVRLAKTIAKERGWTATTVSAWLVVAEGSANRARAAAHRSMLRGALPDDGPTLRAWLTRPAGHVRALSFLAASGSNRAFSQQHRVRRRRAATPVA
jgi:transcriptional regulator with XRE-family HTH domain